MFTYNSYRDSYFTMVEYNLHVFSKNLQRLLKDADISLERFAEIMGVNKKSSRQNKNKIANRILRKPKEYEIDDICEYFSVTRDTLFTSHSNNTNNQGSFNQGSEVNMGVTDIFSQVKSLETYELEALLTLIEGELKKRKN